MAAAAAAAAERLRGPRKLIEGDSARVPDASRDDLPIRDLKVRESTRVFDKTKRNKTKRFSATMGKIENESAHHPSGKRSRFRDAACAEKERGTRGLATGRNEDLSLPAANSREIPWQSRRAKRVVQ